MMKQVIGSQREMMRNLLVCIEKEVIALMILENFWGYSREGNASYIDKLTLL